MRTRGYFLCICIFFVMTNKSADSGSVDRWLGSWMSPSETITSVSSLPQKNASIFQTVSHKMTLAASSILQTVGTYLPLRGVASFAADLGIPGASKILEILTPRTPRLLLTEESSMHSRPFNHRSRKGREQASQRRSSTAGYSHFRPEINSLMGAAHGDRECMLRLACLSGKRLSSFSGASAVAILMSTATDMLPKAIREPYSALKNSVLYSDDCSQYICAKDDTHEDL